MRYASVPGDSHFQPGPLTRIRFYSEFTCNQTYSFPDHQWSVPGFFHLVLIVTPRKGEAFAVIFDRQIPFLATRSQAYQGVPGTAMLSYIHQRFLHNPQYFAAYALWHVQFFKVRYESGIDAGLALKTFDRIFQYAEQPLRVDVNSLHQLHQFPQLQDFLAQKALNAA